MTTTDFHAKKKLFSNFFKNKFIFDYRILRAVVDGKVTSVLSKDDISKIIYAQLCVFQ